MAGSSLRSFIKDVRGAKTVAEERAIVTKASAKIRTKLRDDHLPLEKRRNNIQKLLYLYILGEKTHFGQVECINLIASDDFADKRLGYLAAMLLLDESQDLLTLLTNLLNNDLNHPNRFVVSLALTTLGFLSSSELARDLYPDVESILNTSKDPFLVKKALQCVAKLVMTDSSLLEIFQPQLLLSLLNNQSICTHGVLLSIAKVLQAALSGFSMHHKRVKENEPTADTTGILRQLLGAVPELLDLLQNLNVKNFEPEYDIQGTCDPFLQCELLYTLRLFFQVCFEFKITEIDQYSNKFNDLLTQIATNTDSGKNCGQAILYEATRTIFSLNLNQPSRVLGINILAQFLSGKDNNTKYVALSTLLKVVPQEPVAVQRHRKFISRCLRDPDVSIRSRALELAFAILNDVTMVELTEQLVEFLKNASDDDKNLIVYTVEYLVRAFEIHTSVDEKWKLETLITVLKLVGNVISAETVSNLLVFINNASCPQERCELVAEMLKLTLDDSKRSEISEHNVGWNLVTIWCVGEYGGEILGNKADAKISERSLTKYLVDQHAASDRNDNKIVHYLLTAALKLSAHVNDPGCNESLRQILVSRSRDADLMLQSKSVQYEIIFRQPLKVKKPILDSMPKFEKKIDAATQKPSKIASQSSASQPESSDLLDLLGEKQPSHSPQPQPSVAQSSTSVLSPTDLLADIFGSNGTNGKPSSDKDLSERNSSTLEVPAGSTKIHESAAAECYITLKSCGDGAAQMELYLKAKTNLQNVQTFCAVPKTQKLTLGQIQPGNTLVSHQVARQNLKVVGSGRLKLRVKLNFAADGNDSSEQFDHKFDQAL
ncbi:hypothetical protein HG536_0B04250 [Torulaspora globosa]|uniref:AP-1 complex subunit gamma n=1 Tax=Torulaspora globosa TaxID=48254 RepID=A0A7G3ZDH5_9SACH|nr:uncharacterized protein HG536_0B04250 [Torulaspora globosa]QLL31561.1 hypothetical protein HG536_0B04250 [Torulaspora globosa]